MQSAALGAEFQHVAEDGDAASVPTDRRLAEHGKRGGNRSRIGVVAVVDDERRTARRLDFDRRAAAGDRTELAKRQRSEREIGADKFGRRQNRKRIADQMPARRADLIGEIGAEDLRLDRRRPRPHWMLPDEPLRLPKLAGAIIALGGVTVICARLLGFNGPLAFWGGVAVVLGAASAAFANVLVKARSMQLSPAMLAAWQMIFGTVPLLFLGFVVDGNPARFHWTPNSVFCLLYLAVIGSALTFLLLYWLLPRLTVAQLQSISLITPPGAVMLGWLLGGETFPISSLLGAALVLVGVWMIFRKAPVLDPLIQEE